MKKEQADLKEKAESLSNQIQLQEEQSKSVEQFIEKVKSYSDLSELTPYVLHDLVKAIYIHEELSPGHKHKEKTIRIESDIS